MQTPGENKALQGPPENKALQPQQSECCQAPVTIVAGYGKVCRECRKMVAEPQPTKP